MAKVIKSKLGCDMTINNTYKLLHILERENSDIYVKKMNSDKVAICTFISLRSLNLHRFDEIEIHIPDCENEEYIAKIISKEIQIL
jgi:hypothetical protein